MVVVAEEELNVQHLSWTRMEATGVVTCLFPLHSVDKPKSSLSLERKLREKNGRYSRILTGSVYVAKGSQLLLIETKKGNIWKVGGEW